MFGGDERERAFVVESWGHRNIFDWYLSVLKQVDLIFASTLCKKTQDKLKKTQKDLKDP